MAKTIQQGFAVINLDAIPVNVIQRRKNARSVLLEFPNRPQRHLPASALFKHETDVRQHIASLIDVQRNQPRGHSTPKRGGMPGFDC